MEATDKKKPAPILTASQQKKSITGSSSKGQKRKVVINTLDSPLDLEWPHLGSEREGKITALLAQNLGPVRIESASIPRSASVGIPRKERAEWRKAERARTRDSSAVDQTKMTDCIVGLRDVVKAVGLNQACVVLCDRNPNPPILTKLLVPLCKIKEIPIVALKDFTVTAKKLLRIPRCLTIALKVSAKEATSALYPFYKSVMEICGESRLMSQEGESATGASDACSVPTEDQEMKEVKAATPSPPQPPPPTVLPPAERFHLKKTGRGGVRFVPGVDANPLTLAGMTATAKDPWKDYIALSVDEAPRKSIDAPIVLRPPRIKQIRPNDNKKEKKKKKEMTIDPKGKKNA